jgi:hypothetical protein
MCRFFTQLGVDVHATNNRGATPAEIGKSRHSAEVAAALGGPPMPSAPTLYSKGAKCLTIEWSPITHIESARVMFEVRAQPSSHMAAPVTRHTCLQVQCCTDDGVWRLVARSVRGNTVKVQLHQSFLALQTSSLPASHELSDSKFGGGQIVQIPFALLLQLQGNSSCCISVVNVVP